MKKKSIALLLCLSMVIGMAMTGCGTKASDSADKKEETKKEETAKEEAPAKESASKEAEESAAEESASEESAAEESAKEEGGSVDGAVSGGASSSALNSLYEELADYQFSFASGAGAWSTEVNIKADGSFEGLYHDSEMGDMDANKYPNGTVYYCQFNGQFGDLEKVNEYTYATTIKSISYANKVGEEEYEDGFRYIYSDAYGLDNADKIYFYTKSAPVKDLPDGYKSWVYLMGETEGTLGFYGMYNEKQEEGFSSYFDTMNLTSGVKVDSSLTGVDKIVAEAQAKADILVNTLQTKDLPQSEINIITFEEYTIWDNALNAVWKELKANLSEEKMNEITTEEKQWIKYKETHMEDAAKDWEGGSGYAMIYYDDGAALTKTRVYELVNYLK